MCCCGGKASCVSGTACALNDKAYGRVLTTPANQTPVSGNLDRIRCRVRTLLSAIVGNSGLLARVTTTQGRGSQRNIK